MSALLRRVHNSSHLYPSFALGSLGSCFVWVLPPVMPNRRFVFPTPSLVLMCDYLYLISCAQQLTHTFSCMRHIISAHLLRIPRNMYSPPPFLTTLPTLSTLTTCSLDYLRVVSILLASGIFCLPWIRPVLVLEGPP